MQIVFQGQQSIEQATYSLISILKLFKRQYGIVNFRDITLTVELVDTDGENVELIDEQTSEVFSVFEISKPSQILKNVSAVEYLKLVIDNTKK
jgi:hypothetical protein